MNSLAFNMHISKTMRGKFQLILGVLPLGLMFSSFAVLWLVTKWLSVMLGVPDDVPLKEQENGLLLFVIMMVVMVVLMFAGYIFGWVTNALISKVLFG